MNALSRDLPRDPVPAAPPAALPAAPRAAMARDLLGFASLGAAPVAHHLALASRDTGGPLGIADATWAAGAGALAHAHAAEDELFIVLSGEVELSIAGRRVRRGPGERAFIPRGVEHGFRALAEARILAILTRQSLDAPPTEGAPGARPALAVVPA